MCSGFGHGTLSYPIYALHSPLSTLLLLRVLRVGYPSPILLCVLCDLCGEFMMSFPVHDWQFWVATGAFVLALAWLLKGVLPIPFLSKRAKAKKTQKRVSITIEGKEQK